MGAPLGTELANPDLADSCNDSPGAEPSHHRVESMNGDTPFWWVYYGFNAEQPSEHRSIALARHLEAAMELLGPATHVVGS